jgi:ATP-dependent Lhr-like helicase
LSVFSRFAPRLQEAIVARLGWSSLRPVQEAAGEALLDGHNAVVLAPTAGGKTEAAVFPGLSLLVDTPPTGVGVLYLAPIKALLNNQAERLGRYTEMVGLDRFVWHGDVGASERRAFVKAPTALLMTTPESLEVMLVSPRVPVASIFSDLRLVIVDEVHALAGTDRGAHLMSVLERIARHARHDVQRVGLSATVGNPQTILGWLQGTSRRPAVVVDPPAEPSPRQVLVVYRPDEAAVANDAARLAKGRKSLLFCQSRATTEAVAEALRRQHTAVFVHHSAVSKEERAIAEREFHLAGDACIVCTSTLELGIDVGDLDRVLQAEAPSSVSSFLQRMGRTGRRPGQVANTTFLCSHPQSVLQAAALVELARRKWIEPVQVHDRAWPVLVHQLFAMALASEGMTREDAWSHLSQVPDFKGIHHAEYLRLLRHMLDHQALDEVSGQLVLGRAAERRFGARNFMEMYAVFSSPETYTVVAEDDRPVGQLEQGFVDRLVEGVSRFLLGGRGWLVMSIRHDRRRILVRRTGAAVEPSWSGHLPQFLSRTICQTMAELLASEERFPWLHASAAEVISEWKRDFTERGLLPIGPETFERDGDRLHWWTFAGGRINNTLRYALRACRPHWKIVPSNLDLRIEGADLDDLGEVIARIREPEYWEDTKLWEEIAEDLPNYRLSKFQPFMPTWAVREMVAHFLLDLSGTWHWLRGDAPAPIAPDLAGLVEEVGPVEASAVTPQQAAPGRLPVHWIADQLSFERLCEALASESVIGLDVETTLSDHALCLLQVASSQGVFVVDAFEIEDFRPLDPILRAATPTKVIHNASFERQVLAKHGLEILHVFDTLQVSRAQRGKQVEGHTLKAVCARELGVTMDKEEQTSDWSRRPLRPAQVRYAALDAEVMLRLYEVFRGLVIG